MNAADAFFAVFGMTRVKECAHAFGKAWDDAEKHNEGCAKKGGYGSAVVVRRDPEAPSRIVYADGENVGETVWPPSGRTNGAARWR